MQNKIDAYAMTIGAAGTTDYAREFKRGAWLERGGSPEEAAKALLVELEAEAAQIAIPRKVA